LSRPVNQNVAYKYHPGAVELETMVRYSVATLRGGSRGSYRKCYRVAIGCSYEDEVALLEDIGVTVLPGPSVHWPRGMQVQWLYLDVCFVARPDGSGALCGATAKTPFVKVRYTWPLW
jgi:hypothetical protein